MLSFIEAKVLDTNAQFHGITQAQLMENAGWRVAELVELRYRNQKILVFCGLGNNGGDGFVAARHMAARSILIDRPDKIRTDVARANYYKVRHNVETFEASEVERALCDADVVIDALLGIGVKGALCGRYRECAELLNRSGKNIISVDVPTGFGTETAIRPEVTLTFHDAKEGMSEETCGEIVIADIGMRDIEGLTGPGELLYYPIPEKSSHKGDNGRVLIVGGGPYTGAPALAALASYSVGADLVHIASPKPVYGIIASYSPDFIVHPLSDDMLTPKDAKYILALAARCDAVLIGPGLGAAPRTKLAIKALVAHCNRPLVLDANAFDALTCSDLEGARGILTPHKLEFEKLTGTSLTGTLERDAGTVKAASSAIDMTLLVKGDVDIISDGKTVKLNKSGNAAMTVGGTGDVLSGIAVGLLAKHVEPFNAARMGAFVNGYAGELAFDDKGYSLLATDVIEHIPRVLQRFL